MGEALGLYRAGNAITRFLSTKVMSEIAGAELRAKFESPLKFQWGTGGAEQPPSTVHGFDVTLLQQFPVDLNQDGFRGPGEALWH
jgi:hypothetical protein